MRTLRSAVFGAILVAAVGTLPATAAYAADGFAEASVSPTSLAFGSVNIGHPVTQTVTITSTGDVALTPGTPALSGANASAFDVTANTCAGASLTTGQTCTISVAAQPSAAGALAATLTVPANTAAGSLTADLTATAVAEGGGTYFPVTPARILDTRSGNGAAKAIVGKGGIVHLQVTGRGGVPATGVAAVALNLTVTGPTGPGFLTAYPTGDAKPTASSLNFSTGWTRSNSITVKVGTGGKVDIYTSATTHIIADVAGWYGAVGLGNIGGQLQAVPQERFLDTRWPGFGVLGAGDIVKIPFSYTDGTNSIDPHLKAAIVNITAIGGAKSGFFTAWNGVGNPPAASTVNYTAREITPNLAVVPIAPCGSDCGDYANWSSISIYTLQSAHMLVDIVGLIDDGTLDYGMRLTPFSPTRIVDSRSHKGLPANLGKGQTGVVTVSDTIATPDTMALALNVTGVAPTANTFLTVWPTILDRPGVSNLNLTTGQVVANQVVTLVDPNRQFSVYNVAGTTGVVVDVVGNYWIYPGTDPDASAAGAGIRAGGHRTQLTLRSAPRPFVS